MVDEQQADDERFKRTLDETAEIYEGAALRLQRRVLELEAKLAASQEALREFVAAAKSWHEMHHPIGSAAVQCDWLCECIPAGEEALKHGNSL